MVSGTPLTRSLQASLVAAARGGSSDAVAQLYDLTFSQVYGYAFRLAGNHPDAEDITSETYERALRSLGRYESGEVPFAVWLVRIARNIAMEQLRKRHRAETIALTPTIEAGLAAHSPDSAAIDAASLSLLTPAQREVVALRLAGFKIREIAETLGKAEGTVKALQFAATHRLREVAR